MRTTKPGRLLRIWSAPALPLTDGGGRVGGKPKAKLNLETAVELRAAGRTIPEVAKELGVSVATVKRRLSDAAKGGSKTPVQEGSPPRALPAESAFVKEVEHRLKFVEECVDRLLLRLERHLWLPSTAYGDEYALHRIP